jgi:hypothetical protein
MHYVRLIQGPEAKNLHVNTINTPNSVSSNLISVEIEVSQRSALRRHSVRASR